MKCSSSSGRGTEQAVKAIVSSVKIYKLLGMTNIRRNIMNACREQLLSKCQPMNCKNFKYFFLLGGEKRKGDLKSNTGVLKKLNNIEDIGK